MIVGRLKTINFAEKIYLNAGYNVGYKYRRNMKAVIFDFDGTLTQEPKGLTCWNWIWKYIDDMESSKFLYNQYTTKKIDFKAWYDLTIDIFKDKGVRREYLTDIASKMKLMPGMCETFKQLHENGIKIFVLSGGIKQIIEDTLKRNNSGQFVTLIETYNFIFDKDGKLVGYDSPKSHNIENKNEFIDIVKQEYKLRGEDILFVGNSRNDENARRSGVRTLCINPDGTNGNDKAIWNYSIENCENLTQILKFCEIPKQK